MLFGAIKIIKNSINHKKCSKELSSMSADALRALKESDLGKKGIIFKDAKKEPPNDDRKIVVYCGYGKYTYQIQGFYKERGDSFYNWDGQWLEFATHWSEASQ